MDVNEELKFFVFFGGGGGGRGRYGGGGGQGGCERRIEVFVKIKNYYFFLFFLWGGVGCLVRRGGGVSDQGGVGLGVRVDVNREVKFL